MGHSLRGHKESWTCLTNTFTWLKCGIQIFAHFKTELSLCVCVKFLFINEFKSSLYILDIRLLCDLKIVYHIMWRAFPVL